MKPERCNSCNRPLSNREKRQRVKQALHDHPRWSNRRIAEHVGVSNHLVALLRPKREARNDEPLTPEEHCEIGKRLFAMREELGELRRSLPYGAKIANKVAAAVDKLSALRSSLDKVYAREAGDAFDPTVYYPGRTE